MKKISVFILGVIVGFTTSIIGFAIISRIPSDSFDNILDEDDDLFEDVSDLESE